ncbi:thiamine diphosphokinase [Deltaproteobacteria bacterium OttesenSCG-928-K17]|nr:thiamine diphosphokinase [Deltaproteobacteria bacterium OttesenSCG-928-K17]
MTDRRAPQARAFIFLNGEFENPPDWPRRPAAGDLVIAADGGARHARALGWPIDCLIGDLDSVDPEILHEVKNSGAEIFKYPAEKDEIDFELALNLAQSRGYEEIEVLGALGGRWDMTFGNLFLPRALHGGGGIRFRHGPWTFQTVSGPAEIALCGRPGDLLSLLPLGDDVGGVRLGGCRYPLSGETLKAGLSRGVSNELTESRGELKFDSGTLLIMHRG